MPRQARWPPSRTWRAALIRREHPAKPGARCRDLLAEYPVQVTDRADPREKLRVAGGGVVFAPICGVARGLKTAPPCRPRGLGVYRL